MIAFCPHEHAMACVHATYMDMHRHIHAHKVIKYIKVIMFKLCFLYHLLLRTCTCACHEAGINKYFPGKSTTHLYLHQQSNLASTHLPQIDTG